MDFACDRTIFGEINYCADEYIAQGMWLCENDHPLSFLCCLLYDKSTTNEARIASVAVKTLRRTVSRWFHPDKKLWLKENAHTEDQ